MAISIVISLSIFGQLCMAATYFNELTDAEADISVRVKSATSGLVFLIFAGFLTWGLFTQPLKPEVIMAVKYPPHTATLAKR